MDVLVADDREFAIGESDILPPLRGLRSHRKRTISAREARCPEPVHKVWSNIFW
jgi:hypothetical protein